MCRIYLEFMMKNIGKNGLKYAKIDVKSLSTQMYILSTEMYNNFYTSELTE